MKKRLILSSLFTMVGMVLFAQVAMAYTVTTTGGYGLYQTGQGGEFSLTPNSGWNVLNNYDAKAKTYGGTAFQSFCIEGNEYMNANATYNATLNTAAVNGGISGGNPDPISIGTAKLYYEFAKGILPGFSYGTGSLSVAETAARKLSADLLQQAIWWLEGENSNLTDVTTSNMFQNYLLTTYSAANAKADNPIAQSNLYRGVMALNLTDSNGGLVQDPLVVVPIPGAIWLLGTGLVGLVGARRRRSERA